MLLIFDPPLCAHPPGGRRTGRAAFSDRGRMPSRKIPVHLKPRASDVSGRRFSLVPFLLASTKRNELGRVSGRKRLICAFAYASVERSKVRRFHSPFGERVHFFCWPTRAVRTAKPAPKGRASKMRVKETEPKKKASPDYSVMACCSFRDFSTRHPGSVEKRRTSMCGALRVCGLHCGDTESGKRKATQCFVDINSDQMTPPAQSEVAPSALPIAVAASTSLG